MKEPTERPSNNSRNGSDKKPPRKQRATRATRALAIQQNPCNDLVINDQFAVLIQKMKLRFALEEEVTNLQTIIKNKNKHIATLDGDIVALFQHLQPYATAVQDSSLL